MSTVIYLNNQRVQIVTGGMNKVLQIKDCYLAEAPEGSIINGIIMDTESFVEFLKTTWAEKKLPNKDVTLVINSTKFIGKTIELPKLNHKKTVEFIRREYADMGREGDSVFGYIQLPVTEDKKNRVYAEAIEPDFIQDYISIFNSAGIKLNGIYSGESSLIHFTSKTAAVRSRTFDLIIADANTLTTILWINGTFYYYNTARCFNEPGTLEYADDIARSVSQVIQFLQAQQIEFKLEKVLLAGLDIEHINIYKRAIEDIGLQMPVQAFNFTGGIGADNKYQNFVHGISGLMDAGKSENFLNSMQNLSAKKENEKNSGGGKTAFLWIGLVLILMLIATTVSAVMASLKNRELQDLIDYNNSPERIADIAFYKVFTDRNNFLVSQFNGIDDLQQNIETYPLGNTDVLNVFEKCADGLAVVEHNSFDAAAGTISIQAKADNVENINKFIANLTREDIFNSVDYTGYQYNEAEDMWQINVTCTLADGAGR